MTARRGRPTLLPAPSATGGAKLPEVAAREAACASSTDPDIFFDDHLTADAKRLCSECPVVVACLAHALLHEAHGVWGATTAVEREAMRGGPLVHTPEERRHADRLRELIRQGVTQEDLAAGEGVNTRTLNRWLLDEAQPSPRGSIAA